MVPPSETCGVGGEVLAPGSEQTQFLLPRLCPTTKTEALASAQILQAPWTTPGASRRQQQAESEASLLPRSSLLLLPDSPATVLGCPPSRAKAQTDPVCCLAVCPRMALEPMKATVPPLHILHTRMEHGRICVLQTRIENGRTCILQTSIKHGQTCVLSSWMEHR